MDGPRKYSQKEKRAIAIDGFASNLYPDVSIYDANQFPTDEEQSIDDISLTVSFHNKSLGVVDINKEYELSTN